MDLKYFLLLAYFVYSVIAYDDDLIPPKRYDGYSIIRIAPGSEKNLKLVEKLHEDEELDFWTKSAIATESTDVLVPPHKFAQLGCYLNDSKIGYVVLEQNVQRLIDEEKQESDDSAYISRRKRSLSAFFEDYRVSRRIYEFLDMLKARYPSQMEIQDIGNTYYNKKLKLVKITTNSNSQKSIVWIDGGIHAREWISPATATYFIYKLLTEQDRDNDIKNLLATYDWYIMPLANPDGYDYTFRGDRYWKKNLSKSPVHSQGVDLNRNFPFAWNNSWTNANLRDPTTNDYIGPTALSEKETQAITQILYGVKSRVKLFITLHSYKQYILFPWGCRTKKVKEYKYFQNVGKRASEKIRSYSGTRYQTGSIFDVLYPAPGNSVDWAYGDLGVKHSFAFELRDKGQQGFKLSKHQIVPVGEETWLGIKSILSDIQTA